MENKITKSPMDVQIQSAHINNLEVENLKNIFTPFFEQADEWIKKAKSIKVENADDKEGMEKAREIRLVLKTIRINVEKKRRDLKEESLRRGKAIDGMANVIKFLITPIEEDLEKKEKYAEELEKKRKTDLKQRRVAELEKYNVDTSFYDLENMPEDTYKNLVTSSATAYEMQREAEEKAERERIEKERKEKEEQERIKKENEEMKKKEEIRKREEEEKRKEEEERIKKEQMEKEKIEAEHQARLQKEKEERRKLEAEIEERKKEEERFKKEEEERERQEKLAPDKKKLEKLAEQFSNISMPEVESIEAKEIIKKVIEMAAKTSQFIKMQSINL